MKYPSILKVRYTLVDGRDAGWKALAGLIGQIFYSLEGQCDQHVLVIGPSQEWLGKDGRAWDEYGNGLCVHTDACLSDEEMKRLYEAADKVVKLSSNKQSLT